MNDPDRHPPTCPECGSYALDADAIGNMDCRDCGWSSIDEQDEPDPDAFRDDPDYWDGVYA